MKSGARNSSPSISFVDEKKVAAAPGDTILSAALRGGIPHFHSCGGKARCSTCKIIVHSGESNISAIDVPEERLRKRLSFPSHTRLACQAKILGGEAVVERIIKPDAAHSEYTGLSKQLVKLILKRSTFGSERGLMLFFLDIRNFTPFVARSLPFDVVHVTRRIFDIIYRVIGHCNGKIIETAGDQVFAVFGLNSVPADSALSAIKAGRMVIDAIDVFNRTYLEVYFRSKLSVGIGIHFGNVIVGDLNLGMEYRMSVIGLPVIRTARVQEATRKLNNSLLVTDSVIKHACDGDTPPATYVTLKGLRGRYKVYKLGDPFD